MTILVLSDVHANLPALEAVLAAETEWDELFFLGDTVDCGPWPNAVLDLLAEVGSVHLMGNHDRLVLDTDPLVTTSSSDQQGRQWTKRQLSTTNLRRLETFQSTHRLERDGLLMRLHHGNFAPPASATAVWQSRLHPERESTVFETLAERYPEPYVLHGHSHIPFVRTVDGTTFVNPGSVGLQREGWDPTIARYAVLHDGEFSLCETTYDVSRVRKTVAHLPLSRACIDDWRGNFDERANTES